MKFVFKVLLTTCSLFVALLVSCDDSTAFIGSDIMPGGDNISTSKSSFRIKSQSIKVDSVLANTNDCFLGCVVDPETRSRTKAGFLAQFHMMEDFQFPDKKKMILDKEGNVVTDSCAIRIFFDDYYGDSLATMKLYVHELDTNKVLKENVPYYSNLDYRQFINEKSIANTSLAYAVKDFSKPNVSGSSLRSIVVKLPNEYGAFLVNKYYENPSFFKNSYQFIHHVCPGFNFETIGSIGSMINVEVAVLDVYFRYHEKNSAGRDTIMEGMHRMASTEEVIQNTHIDNTIPDWMLNQSEDYSFVKSPTGIFTELVLPVDEVVAGEHYTDTINSAKLSIRSYKNTVESDYHLRQPSSLLMLRKSDMFKFFERGDLPDGKSSYISTFDSFYNAYQFTNIGQLLTIMKLERDQATGVTKYTEETVRKEKYQSWESQNPDWNKVVLIPVNAEYSISNSIYGSSKTLLRVRNLFELSSAKLEGGTSGNIEMQVIYSRFEE